jgi:hypothetical protein
LNFVGKIEHITVRALAVQLEKTMNRWYAGHLPKIPTASASHAVIAKAK